MATIATNPHYRERLNPNAPADGSRQEAESLRYRITLREIELRYLERLLGRRPTKEDAVLLPGIDLSDL
jgi:hypothetical protein